MSRRQYLVCFVLLSVLSMPLSSAHALDPPCAGYIVLEGVGPACPKNGAYELLIDQGSGVLTHGADPLLPQDLADPVQANSTATNPVCVSSSLDYQIEIIYARPLNVSDGYATQINPIKNLVKESAGRLIEDAAQRGAYRNYRVMCDLRDEIVVHNISLPTSSSADSFTSVVDELRAAGYDNNKHKYWVWYDGSVGSGIAGTGHIYPDDSLSANNLNNGASGTRSMFAVQWGAVAGFTSRTWIHELGHTMGAVQNSAPNSTDAGHCNDGQDVMCYDDGGPSSNYNANVCMDREYFDCGYNDYFDPATTPNTYLQTHWNLGSTLSRYLSPSGVVPPPVMKLLSSAITAAKEDTLTSVAVTQDRLDGATSSATWTLTETSPNPGVVGTGSVEIPPNSNQGSIPIALNDSLYSGTRNFSLQLSSPTNATLGTPSTATISLIDDETQPLLKFDASVASVQESTSNVVLKVTREGAAANQVGVTYATSPGTATTGIDFTSSTASLSFAPRVSEQFINVPIISDALAEPTETFSVALSSPTGLAAVASPSTIVVSITDDDLPTVKLTTSTYSGSEQSAIPVSVLRSAATTKISSVPWTMTQLSPPGGVIASGTLQVAAGATVGSVSIALDDSLYTGTRSLQLGLGTPTNAELTSPTSLAVTLTDNEIQPLLSFTVAGRNVSENAGQQTIQVRRTGALANAVTALHGAVSGSATVGSDVAVSPTTLAFASGETLKSYVVTVVDDTLIEAVESLTLVLQNPTGFAAVGASSTISINASDQRPDLLISAAGPFIGDNEYSSPQKASTPALPTQEKTFTIRVQNDGNVFNFFLIKATPAESLSEVKYFNGTVDVTSLVLGVGLTLPFNPGQSRDLVVRMSTLWPTNPDRASFDVSGTWTGDSSISDMVSGEISGVI